MPKKYNILPGVASIRDAMRTLGVEFQSLVFDYGNDCLIQLDGPIEISQRGRITTFSGPGGMVTLSCATMPVGKVEMAHGGYNIFVYPTRLEPVNPFDD